MGAAATEVTVPDSGGRSLRDRLRAPPVMGGLLPMRRSEVAADVLAGITLWPPLTTWLPRLVIGK